MNGCQKAGPEDGRLDLQGIFNAEAGICTHRLRMVRRVL